MNYDTLRQLFETIRDERRTAANTAQRIGQAFLALLSSLGEVCGSMFLRKDQEDTAAAHISFAEGISIVGKALMNVVRSGENLSNSGTGADNAVLSEKKALEILLRKDIPETLTHILTLTGGLQTSLVRSSDFQTGDGGQGFAIREVGGHMVLEIDDIVARRRLSVSVLDVQRTMFSQGRQVLTQANGTIERVVALDSSLQPIGISMTGFSADGYVYVLTEANAELTQQQVDDTFSAAYAYKLYFLASDDSRTIRDYWRCGDLVLCREFNIAQRTNPDSDIDGNPVHNHHFHRLVLAHGAETISSKAYNFIVVANAHAVATEKVPVRIMIPLSGNEADAAIYPHDSSDTYFSRDGVNPLVAWSFDGSLPNTIPAVGDDVVHYGSVLDATRRGATALSPDSAGGILTHEKGIGGIIAYEPTVTEDGDTYNVADELSSPIIHQAVVDAIADWSAQQFYRQRETIHLGDSFSVEASSFLLTTSRGGVTESRPVPYMVDHPFVPGTDTANYYEQWTYGGQQWLCRAINGTSATPSTSSPDWLLVTAKGADGHDGVDGQDGRDGIDGQDGQPGADGKDGKDGKDGTNGQDGQPGADGHDGADGKDAWVVETSPAFITIEERLLKNKDVVTPTSDDPDDYYLPEDAQGIPHLQVAVIAPSAIEIRILKGGSRITPSSLNFWEKNNQRGCSSNLTVSLVSGTTDRITVGLSTAGTTDRSTQGEIYLIVSFTEDGATRTQYVTLPVAINRTGTYVSETIGDVTVDTRRRIAAVDGKTETYKSQWVAEASGIKGRLDKVVTSSGGKGQWITHIEATAEGISQSVSELEDDVEANYSEFTQTAQAISQSVGAVDGRVSTVEQTADYIRLGVNGMSSGNILGQTDWKEGNIASNYTVQLTDRGAWDNSETYNRFDKVSSGPGGSHTYVLIGTDQMLPGGTDPYTLDDPSMWLEYVDTGTIDKWACENLVWKVGNAYNNFSAFHVLRPVYETEETKKPDTSRLKQNVYGKLTANTIYTLSFYYRSRTQVFLNMSGFINTNAAIKDKNNNSGGILFNEVAVPYGTERSDIRFTNANPVIGNTDWAWKYVSITFQAKSGITSSAYLGFDAYSHSSTNILGEFEVTMVKLERGSFATPWNDIPSALKRSGVDITAEKIVATTDHFEIQNSDGQTTFTVDEHGNIKGEGNAEFAGTVNASVLYVTYQKVPFTYTDIGTYDREMTAARLLSSCEGGKLPQRLVLCSGNDNTNINMAADNNMHVYLPDAMDYEGMEIEIFFPSTYLDNNKKSLKFNIWCPQAHKVYHAIDDTYTDAAAMPIKDGLWGVLWNRVYPSGGYISTARDMCKVRLRSTPVVTERSDAYGGNLTEWEWVLLEKTNCIAEQYNP